ncbi:MAG: alpha-L-fucosidase [Clostridia bacterium]
MFDKIAHEKRMAQFLCDRFGMFIHFGLYAIPARGEWIRSTERMSEENYAQYFYEFNPKRFDAKVIARAAKNAGMKYAVLTAKHHDGFCLFDTKTTDYNVMNTPFKRDIVSEFLTAFREEGLRVGLYYSLIDWHHEDFPHYNDPYHPMRENDAYKDDDRNFDRYLSYMHTQIRELIENYGKLDIMWFDFSYGKMRGDKWRAKELIAMIREKFPDIIIDNRLEVSGEGFGSLVTDEVSDFSGDFVSPEQIIPCDGILNSKGESVPWEACITLNNNWGYCESDKNYKSGEQIIKKLIECVSKNGNLLLNVSPNAMGELNDITLNILNEIGAWMRKNGESIYACGHVADKIENGRITGCGENIRYYHIMEPAINDIPLFNLDKSRIKSVRLLSTGAELKLSDSWITDNYPDIAFVRLGANPALPNPVTVIKVVMKD